jgi:hypothetical protein
MKKYKLSEGNFNKFLSFFGIKSSERPKSMEDIISNDPKLKKLDKQMGDLNRQAAERVKNDPNLLYLFKRAGIDI